MQLHTYQSQIDIFKNKNVQPSGGRGETPLGISRIRINQLTSFKYSSQTQRGGYNMLPFYKIILHMIYSEVFFIFIFW